MSAEDIWSLLTQQMYPPGGTSSSSRKEENGEGKASGGEDTNEVVGEKEGAPTAAFALTSFALCVGMPGAGKTSLLTAYLNPNNDNIPKPTVALEYMFARRANMPNAPKV